ncbi:MAG: hypothetical protein WC494_02390 [Candidatus Pacearchaeota archaeon]
MKNLRQIVKNSAGAGLIGLASLVGGCNDAYMRPFARSVGESIITQAAVSTVDSSIRNEIEGPRAPTTNVYVQESGSGSQGSSNVQGSVSAPQIYSTEIWNLDRNEKEDIEIYGGPEFINSRISDYLCSKATSEDCSKKGYKIVQKLNEAPIKIRIIDSLYSVELWNLDRNEREDFRGCGGVDSTDRSTFIGERSITKGVEPNVGGEIYDYLCDKWKENSLNGRRYEIIQKLNGTPIRSGVINIEVEEVLSEKSYCDEMGKGLSTGLNYFTYEKKRDTIMRFKHSDRASSFLSKPLKSEIIEQKRERKLCGFPFHNMNKSIYDRVIERKIR